eukprot:5271309-Pyramimonas_sp.AAC.1
MSRGSLALLTASSTAIGRTRAFSIFVKVAARTVELQRTMQLRLCWNFYATQLPMCRALPVGANKYQLCHIGSSAFGCTGSSRTPLSP